MATSSSRPATHKPRGLCRYYNHPRGCFAGNKCKFLHGEPPADTKPEDPPLLTPYDKSKRCRYYDQGFCKRGDTCWFIHATDSKEVSIEEEDEELCSICFEKPTTYGLLSGCSHIFCISCIKQWRDPSNKPGGMIDSSNTKKCPMCRSSSRFITPSSKFWKGGTQEKDGITQAYKESMARIPCRYFQKTLQKNSKRPLCPYGKDCFYQHLNEDGTPHILKDGVDVCMRRYQIRASQNSSLFESFRLMPFTLDLSTLDIAPSGDLTVVPGQILPPDIDPREIIDQEYTTRRIHEVGRSLEMLNDAIGDNASLTSLDQAVEALRAGLGRLGGASDTETSARRRTGRNRRQGDDQDDAVMERLEILADQMFMSINALRRTEEIQQMQRVETPPPPLEPIEGYEGTPPLPLHPLTERTRGLSHSRSEDSLPGLQSVSTSSSENEMSGGDDDDDDDDDMEERETERSHHALNIAGLPWNELFEGWTPSQMVNVPQPETEENSATEAPLQPSATDGDMSHEQDEGLVTDGRGRAVWTEEDKGDGEFTTDGRGRVISVGTDTGEQSESSRGSSRSFMDWFSGLF